MAQLTPEQQAEQNKLTEKYIELLQRVNGMSTANARIQAEGVKTAGNLNKEVERLEEYLNDLNSSADYLFKSFRETTGELKNQNVLLSAGRSVFKNLTGIAEDLKYAHQGISDLSEKDLKKKIEAAAKSKDQLKNIVSQLGTSQGLYKQQQELDRLTTLALDRDIVLSKSQKARLETLNKEKELYEASKNALKEGIPLLEKEINLTQQIVKSRENLGGITQATGKLLTQLGGSLSSLLNISEATESVEKYNKELIDGALNSKKVQDELLKREKEKERIQNALDSGIIRSTSARQKAQEALTKLEKEQWEIKQKAIEGTNTLSNRFKSLGVFAKGLGEGLKKALTDPVAILSFFVGKALTANEQIVNIGKSLGAGAEGYREKLVEIESASSNINVTTANLSEAYGQLVQSTGLAYQFTEDQLVTQVKLTKQVGLQADEAAGIQRLAVLNGKTSEETYKSFVKGLVASRNQLKVGIDMKSALAEASKVSGQLAANLGYNPERIAKAVVTAKALGMTLDQVAKSGESLLNFESSIESELKAELLTGKELNLERARAAALAGDQVTLAEELAKNVGTAKDFAKMNVLQQKALAESMGMTTDELAESLRKREEAIASGKSLAQLNEEEAQKALERQTIQDQFNQGIEKLQSLIGNLLAGPLGAMLDILVKIVNVVNLIIQPFTWLVSLIKQSTAASVTFLGVLSAIYIKKNQALLIDKAQIAIAAVKNAFTSKAIAQEGLLGSIKKRGFWKTLADAAMTAFKSVAKIPIVGPILGAVAAAGAVALGSKLISKGDDVVSPGYGKRTLMSPEGSIALNDKDTVIAGTNLGGGAKNEEKKDFLTRIKEKIVGKEEAPPPPIDITPLVAAINAVKASVDKLYNKDTSINMDGNKVGTTLSQGSYKVA